MAATSHEHDAGGPRDRVAETPGAGLADEVVDLHWPTQAAARDERARRGLPRLLIVDHGCVPPWGDALEDWVRPDADVLERYARREALRRRAVARAPASIDADGLLHRGASWVALPPGELAAVTALLEASGAMVSRADLGACIAAKGGLDGPRALDNVMRRIRRRIDPLGMAVCAIRGAGFLLEVRELPPL